MPKATSKAQVRKFWALENAGEVPPGTAKRHTPKNVKNLPERVRRKQK